MRLSAVGGVVDDFLSKSSLDSSLECCLSGGRIRLRRLNIQEAVVKNVMQTDSLDYKKVL